MSTTYSNVMLDLETMGTSPDAAIVSIGAVAFDPLRLRIIQGGGHHNPAARAVYYPHRDTWYGHPQSLVVGWIPLDDLREEETFVFFPDYLRRAAPNDSEIFDYDAWVAAQKAQATNSKSPVATVVAAAN